MRATLVFRDKSNYPDGSRSEIVIWKVPKDLKHPEGYRYRLAFIPVGHSFPAVLYDNHHPRSHHKHIERVEVPYEFQTLERLRADFHADIGRWIHREEPKQ